MEKWDGQIDRYKLTAIAEGVYVYKLVVADRPSELEIPFCVNCFGNRKKSVLQRASQTPAGIIYSCPNCQTNITDHSKPGKKQTSMSL